MEMQTLRIKTGEWLLPEKEVNPEQWACVACDQFTSQPEYWAKARDFAGKSPSALKLIIPECELEGAEEKAPQIHKEMHTYLEKGILRPAVEDGWILTLRLTESGMRPGLLVLIDLEGYDYKAGSRSLIRPTEGTIVERIPPRLAVRRGAPVELGHVMMLIDDPEQTVVEPLVQKYKSLQKLYDFPLMMGGGRLSAYAVTAQQDISAVVASLQKQKEKSGEAPLLYAVGDGNHSLATAKAYWEEIKPRLTPAEAENHPARFSMVEIVNLHSEALQFEPIHRVLFDACGSELMADFMQYMKSEGINPKGKGEPIVCLFNGGEERVTPESGAQKLEVGILQLFLDGWLKNHPEARIDYIHGEETLRKLVEEQKAVGFILPAPRKEDLFPAVSENGALPRKTFSMGEAWEKRYYMEARKIVP